jgi:peptidyl-prolyl cis-trans isomerase A (cyclophilin A)
MKKFAVSIWAAVIIFALVSFASTGFKEMENPRPRVKIMTDLGDIVVEIYKKEAPVTASNFLQYVEKGLYKGSFFYRVVTMDNQPNNDVKIEVIQGGLRGKENAVFLPPIEHETTEMTGVRHKDGVISMARSKPGTASSEFFICINDQPELDFGGKRNPDGQGFAAFGKVISGMDIVKKIQKQPSERQMLNPSIIISDIVWIE